MVQRRSYMYKDTHSMRNDCWVDDVESRNWRPIHGQSDCQALARESFYRSLRLCSHTHLGVIWS